MDRRVTPSSSGGHRQHRCRFPPLCDDEQPTPPVRKPNEWLSLPSLNDEKQHQQLQQSAEDQTSHSPAHHSSHQPRNLEPATPQQKPLSLPTLTTRPPQYPNRPSTRRGPGHSLLPAIRKTRQLIAQQQNPPPTDAVMNIKTTQHNNARNSAKGGGSCCGHNPRNSAKAGSTHNPRNSAKAGCGHNPRHSAKVGCSHNPRNSAKVTCCNRSPRNSAGGNSHNARNSAKGCCCTQNARNHTGGCCCCAQNTRNNNGGGCSAQNVLRVNNRQARSDSSVLQNRQPVVPPVTHPTSHTGVTQLHRAQMDVQHSNPSSTGTGGRDSWQPAEHTASAGGILQETKPPTPVPGLPLRRCWDVA